MPEPALKITPAGGEPGQSASVRIPTESGEPARTASLRPEPRQAAPVQAAPVQAAPVQAAPPQAAPVLTAPAPAPPVQQAEKPTGCEMAFTIRGEEKKAVFTEFPAVIGRDVINDGTVSMVHCSLNIEDGRMIIRDLESANGVYVNGIRISQPTAVQRDDRVIIGRAMASFRFV
jgi:hypothetical protein